MQVNNRISLTGEQFDWIVYHCEPEFDRVSLPCFEWVDPTDQFSLIFQFNLDTGVLSISGENVGTLARLCVARKSVIDGKTAWEIVLDERLQNLDRETLSEYWQETILRFACIQGILLSNPDDLFEVEEKIVRTRLSKKKVRKGGNPHVVRLYRSYTLKRDWEKTVIEHRKYHRTCERWSVRGHFRHYKSGKVVFIESYEKGKKSGILCAKEYKLMPAMPEVKLCES